MTTVIRLLGVPRVDCPGTPTPSARGRKAWALLACLLLAERPPSRQRLATLLFPEADDPLTALRWTLADLRRALGPHAEVSGDPVRVVLAPGVVTDLDLLGAVDLPDAASPTGELLEGLTLDRCPAFETWLQVQRLRIGGTVEALLRERALRHLGLERPTEALAIASDLVELNPLDETNQVLLVRCLAAVGARDAAAQQVRRCTELFRDELGTTPSPALRAAAGPPYAATDHRGASGRAAAAAQLEAGEAAVHAGAVEAGLQCLHRAVLEAGEVPDEDLRVRALIALGSALVHSVRGRDEEGAAVLHQALAAAEPTGDASAAGRACRELGFVDVQAGRRVRAEHWLARAESAATSPAERAAVLGYRGMNQSDEARYPEALESLQRSVEHALDGGTRRQAAWSLSIAGRLHLLRGDTDTAVATLERSLQLVHDTGWTAFAPWPQSLRAEVDRAEGHHDRAEERYSHAFALACQIEDPCWEGVAARGAGLLQADSGDVDGAMRWLQDASARCLRWPDTYQWVHAYVLDAVCEVGLAAGLVETPRWVARLEEVAARGAMRELVVRAQLHQARLGRPGAADAAAQGATEIDNPALAGLVRSLGPSTTKEAP